MMNLASPTAAAAELRRKAREGELSNDESLGKKEEPSVKATPFHQRCWEWLRLWFDELGMRTKRVLLHGVIQDIHAVSSVNI